MEQKFERVMVHELRVVLENEHLSVRSGSGVVLADVEHYLGSGVLLAT